jgi:hypothetical protein
MQDFQWIHKVFIGAGGTLFSFFIEHYSVVMSSIAGTLTVIYLLQQVIYMHMRKAASKEEWEHQRTEREYQVRSRERHDNE